VLENPLVAERRECGREGTSVCNLRNTLLRWFIGSSRFGVAAAGGSPASARVDCITFPKPLSGHL
jgi:hypothetical protein